MCGIFGWYGNIDKEEKQYIIEQGYLRGRDGYGMLYDNNIKRSINKIDLKSDKELIDDVIHSNSCIGNFRATPTTEILSKVEYMQPYSGIVHNGVISNDKDIADVPIDSMVLPFVFPEGTRNLKDIKKNINKLVGSYAIAFYNENNTKLYLITNYKPIYYRRNKSGIVFTSIPEMLKYESTPISPYTINEIDLSTFELSTISTHTVENKKVLVSASAGLDSTTVAYMLKSEGYDVTLIHFLYGCLAESNEITRIKQIAEHGDFKLDFIEMPKIFNGTIVSNDYHKGGVEGTEYAMDWVSARNLLMMSLLTAYSETHNYSYIAFGGNLEEGGAYPDNEEEFARKFNELLPYSTQNGKIIKMLHPLTRFMKHEIIKLGNEVDVPWELTWSCYSDNEEHCGECGPCFMRKTAFERNHITDPVFNHKK